MKTNANGFIYNEVKVVKGRERYLLNGEVIALQCTACKDSFPLDGFHNSKAGVVGKFSQCQPCNNKRKNQWREQNPERVKEHNNSYEKMAINHNYRAKQAGNEGKLHGDHIEELYWIATRIENDQEVTRCMVSGEVLLDKSPHIGHIVSVDEDKGHSKLGNLLLISPRVNINQGSRNMLSFLVTERGQALVDKERVRWSLEWLAQKNYTSVDSLVSSILKDSDEQELFYELYLKEEYNEEEWIEWLNSF